MVSNTNPQRLASSTSLRRLHEAYPWPTTPIHATTDQSKFRPGHWDKCQDRDYSKPPIITPLLQCTLECSYEGCTYKLPASYEQPVDQDTGVKPPSYCHMHGGIDYQFELEDRIDRKLRKLSELCKLRHEHLVRNGRGKEKKCCVCGTSG